MASFCDVPRASLPAGWGGVSPPVLLNEKHAPGRCLNPQPGRPRYYLRPSDPLTHSLSDSLSSLPENPCLIRVYTFRFREVSTPVRSWRWLRGTAQPVPADVL